MEVNYERLKLARESSKKEPCGVCGFNPEKASERNCSKCYVERIGKFPNFKYINSLK